MASRFDLLTFSDEENSSDSENDNSNEEIVTVDAEVSLRRDKGAVSGDLSNYDTEQSNGISLNRKSENPGEVSLKATGKIPRSVVNIPTFSGFSKESIIDFHEEFERASLINGWNKRAQSLLLPVYLGGRAKDYYLAMGKGVKGDIDQVWGELNNLFNSSAHQYQAKQLAYQRIQQKGESVSVYFQNISTLVRKAWGSGYPGREKLIECFVNGLKPNIKKIFYNKEPQSLEEALNSAEAREMYLKSKIKSSEVQMVRRDTGGEKTGRVSEKMGDEISDLKQVVGDLKIKLEKQDVLIKERDDLIRDLLAPGTAQNSNNAQNPSRKNAGNSNRRPSCWGCGSFDHFRNNCPRVSTMTAASGSNRGPPGTNNQTQQ